MPGIAGLITKRPAQWANQQLQTMLSTLCHEPFYASGTWKEETLGVYAGWVAGKDSFSDEMPLINEKRDMVLLFAGEEYSDPRLPAELRRRGHTIDDKPAAYLAHVAEEDPEFPRGLNGRFHGLLINRTIATAVLFNDRYGMQRLYYHEAPDAFLFAAEAKAILAVCPDLRRVDLKSLGEFVACGCVLENRTIFQGIRVLPTASKWTFQKGTLQLKGSYFSAAEWERQDRLDAESYYTQLRSVFARNLPRYFNGREKVGISLTGGLDTRMIMAWARPEPQSLPSYTFGGPYRDCQDVVIARKVAEICHQPHRVIPVDGDFLRRFGHYAERTVYLTDGCVGVNRAADLYANEIARQIAPVRMTGNYGSEILRHLRVFKPADPAPELFQAEFVSRINEAKSTYQAVCQGHAVTFAAFKQAPWYQFGLLGLEQTQLFIRSPFLDNDLVRTVFQAPSSEIIKSDLFEDSGDCTRLIADGNAELQKIPTDRGLGGATGWRAPLLRGYLEFTFKAEYAYDYGMPQWLARVDHRLSWLHFERLFLGRHKFCHFRPWYKTALSGYVKEILLDPRSLSRPYVQPKVMQAIVLHHVKGDRNYTSEITRLLTLELQHRLFLDSN